MNELLKSLSENWTIGNNYESSIQKRIWDRRAEDFDAHPLPSFEKDDFLRLMCEEMPLVKEMQTLDVGCGTGRYSIALAEKVGHAFGVDISPNMITAAKKRAETMGIDNCLIQVNGPEFPILDGSAIMYVEKIQQIGIEEQNAPKDWYIIRKKIEVKDDKTGSCITILPDEEFSITAMCSFESKFINSQFATIDNVSNFAKEIAPARTFVFVRDIEPLLQANLIKGGDLDNAIVIYERQTTQERLDTLADMLKVPHMDANNLGYIQNKPLVWDNECTRHKLLDIIGDMALIGKPIKGRIIATRPGHTINNKFARLMRKEIKKHEIQAPIYDPNDEPVMDNIRIRELLPHRYPMQLVDKVISIGATSIIGVKNVTSNEPFFVGHFPQEPVMPGVLQIEAMAQCGGLLVLNTLEEPERWSTYFMKIDDVKFRQKVVPGDTLIFKVDLLAPIRHGVSSMKGYIFVGDKIVSEATFTAQIVKNK